MTPQELKNSILQLAIQGKLVEQCPEEGSAEELIAILKNKKQELLNQGKIYKKKSTKPFYTDKDLESFNIPKTWSWVQLSDVSLIQEGAGIRKWQYRDSGVQILCVTNILDGAVDLTKKELYISEEEYNEKYCHLTLNKGDIVTACSGGSWGKVAIFNSDNTIMLNTSTLRMRFWGDICCNEFLYYICQSQFFKNQLQRQLSGMQPNFGYAHYSRIIIPLPPLAEQKRIVAKIEELLPYIDCYEQAWSKLEQFNNRFPEDMKKSLLQYAIQGKLVEQRPEEGTAEELFAEIQNEKQKLIAEKKIKKEKPLPEITDDEKQFDIPQSWMWVRFSDVIDVRDGTHDTPKYVLKGIPLVTSKNLVSGKIDFDSTKLISKEDAAAINMRSEVNTGDILFAMIGTIGNPVLVKKDREFCIKNMALFKPIDSYLFDMNYLLLFLQKEQEQMKKIASGGVQSFVSLKFLRNYLLPLPPLAEQKRIVEKLEQLLPLRDRLK